MKLLHTLLVTTILTTGAAAYAAGDMLKVTVQTLPLPPQACLMTRWDMAVIKWKPWRPRTQSN